MNHDHNKKSHLKHSGHNEHDHDEKHGDHSNHHEMMAADFKRRFFVALTISIPVLILSPTIQGWLNYSVPVFPGDKLLLFALASVIVFYTAWPFYIGAWDELKKKQFGMMVLVSLAVGTGYLYSVAGTFFITAPDFYWEISTLVLVLLLGHWIEMRAVVGTTGALKELARLIPPTANKIVGSDIRKVNTEELKLGDLFLVRPGEKIPTDGEVVEGSSNINEALITGESKPVSKGEGDEVIGGALNTDGSLTVKVTKEGKDTALSQIIALVKDAQSSKPKTQKLADRAAHYLTLTAIIVGALTFFSWNFLLGASFVFALTLTITVIVITCPHALGLAIPTVTTITSSLAARNGILIKDMNGLERAHGVDWVVFDKTGTLTEGSFGVSDIIEFDEKINLLQLAATLEQYSEHVIAKAIVEEARQRKLRLTEAKNFKAVPGKGVISADVVVGTARLMKDRGIEIAKERGQVVSALEEQGKTAVYVSLNNNLVGVIALADTIKPQSKSAINKLKKSGVKVAMLTGDNKQTAAYVAGALGLDNYFAEVLPEDKVDTVKRLQQGKSGQKQIVMMVGDGVNDAPALTQADVGVAIGAGTDVAVESAEIVLVKNNPLDIVKLINLSRQTMRKMKQNLAWATGYNIIAIPLAAGVLAGYGVILRPEWGALAMSASSVIVVVNAMMLKRVNL